MNKKIILLLLLSSLILILLVACTNTLEYNSLTGGVVSLASIGEENSTNLSVIIVPENETAIGSEIVINDSVSVDPILNDTPTISNVSIVVPEASNSNNSTLAKIFNQDNIEYDPVYAKNYLDLHHNFSDMNFKRIGNEKEEFTLSLGNKVDDIRGFRINKSKFVIHLVYCDEFEKFCKFRINGVPTTKMYTSNLVSEGKSNSFDFDKDYTLKVNSAKFNQCDNHRFCNLGFEGYHIINVSVEKKR